VYFPYTIDTSSTMLRRALDAITAGHDRTAQSSLVSEA